VLVYKGKQTMRRKRFHQAVPEFTGPERAAIYGRVSTIKQRGRNEDEDSKLSLEDQEAGCRKLCQEKGYIVNEAYVLREVSSGDNVHRPLLEEIYAAAKRGEIDLLVMYKVNRFARNEEKATYLYGRALYEHNMRIEFVEAPPSEKLARFHLKFKSIFAEEYRDEVMQQTKEKRRERVTKRGLLMPGAWPLFGYSWDNEVKKGRYVIDEEAATIVRRVFALAAGGMSMIAIARLFNAEGVPTPSLYQSSKGRFPESRRVSPLWHQGNIARMLRTPAYWGEHVAFRWAHQQVVEQNPASGKYEAFHEVHERKAGDETMIPLPPTICPPIVEKWQAEAAHQRAQANKHEAGRHGRTTQQALLRGGYLLCGYCGRPMYATTNPPHLPRYYCRSIREHQEGLGTICEGKGFSLRHDKIDQAVWQDIMDYFSDPEWLERILARERKREAEEADDRAKRLQELDENLAAKEADADELVRLSTHITSTLMRQKLAQQMNVVGEELEALQQEREKLLLPSLTAEHLAAQTQAFHTWADAALSGLAEAPLEEKRLALYWLGVEVRVWRSTQELDYELTLTWRGLNANRPLILRERVNTESLMHVV
jgi:site-specific DNA recombinase